MLTEGKTEPQPEAYAGLLEPLNHSPLPSLFEIYALKRITGGSLHEGEGGQMSLGHGEIPGLFFPLAPRHLSLNLSDRRPKNYLLEILAMRKSVTVFTVWSPMESPDRYSSSPVTVSKSHPPSQFMISA